MLIVVVEFSIPFMENLSIHFFIYYVDKVFILKQSILGGKKMKTSTKIKEIFKDMKIAKKLITSFITISIISVIIGFIGIVGMTMIDKADTKLYEVQAKPLGEYSHFISSLIEMEVQIREAVINSGNIEAVKNAENNFNTELEKFRENSEAYSSTIKSKGSRALFDEADNIFKETFLPLANEVFRLSKSGDERGAYQAIKDTKGATDKMLSNFEELLDNRIADGKETSDSNSILARSLTIILIVVIFAGTAFSIFLGKLISKMISDPVIKMVDVANKIAVGDTDVDIEIDSKDEIGILGGAFNEMIAGIKEQVNIVSKVAEGDLSFEVTPRSERDIMGISLEATIKQLNNMFNNISQAAEQVLAGSNQLSDGAQSLSQGATEQASSIEELAATINEISEHIHKNAKNAEETKNTSLEAAKEVEKGSEQISDMVKAMDSINEESVKIGKIIKAIEDIAFQTNILALNAAVEAARAGSAGKGFAVVADEVRNLATKSSEAAKDTTQLIESSMKAVSNGMIIAEKTSQSLVNIVEKTNKTTKLIEEIATASEQQAVGASQISVGIEQVSAVVQTNSATAEESAAASEELLSQANLLNEQISLFKLR
jgi:methyl-accepting chemotaxis protein